MKVVPSVEFNITNVCNLACTGCNRFNHMNLTGYEDWKKHREAYKNFSKHVEISEVHVLGGEPLMHPMINEILDDVRSWFPEQQLRIVTNGLLVHKIKGFLDAVKRNNVSMNIYIHNREWRIPVYEKLCEATKEKIRLKWRRNHPGWELADFEFNGCMHTFNLAEHFTQNTLGEPVRDILQPYESDREKAFKACATPCPTLNGGKFYKCPISHALPDVIRQKNNINYTQDQKDLIDTFPFVPCDSVQSFPDEKFHALVNESIKQCSLCPEKQQYHKIGKMDISPNYF